MFIRIARSLTKAQKLSSKLEHLEQNTRIRSVFDGKQFLINLKIHLRSIVAELLTFLKTQQEKLENEQRQLALQIQEDTSNDLKGNPLLTQKRLDGIAREIDRSLIAIEDLLAKLG